MQVLIMKIEQACCGAVHGLVRPHESEVLPEQASQVFRQVFFLNNSLILGTLSKYMLGFCWKHWATVPARLLPGRLGCREGWSSRNAATITNNAYEPIPPWYTCIPPYHAELAPEVHVIGDWSCQLLQTCQHAGAVYKVLG